MKKFKIFNFISAVFRIFLIFLISFVWIRYFVNSLKAALVLSSVVTIVFDFFLMFLSNRKKSKLNKATQYKFMIESFINSFIFNDDSYALNFYYKLAKSRHNAEKKSKFVLITHSNFCVVLFPYYTFRPFGTDDLIFVHNYVKNLNPTKIIVCVNKVELSVLKLAEKFSKAFIILDGEQSYEKLMKEYNIFPEKTLSFESKETVGWKDLFAYALSRKRTKGYFFASIVLLFSSFIVNYNIYYCIMSSVLLLLALVSFVNPKFNQKTIENNLLN